MARAQNIDGKKNLPQPPRQGLLGSVAFPAQISVIAPIKLQLDRRCDMAGWVPSLAGRADRADADGGPLQAFAWRYLALVEVVNFLPLRRRLGAHRAESLVMDVADLVSSRLPNARLAVVSRTTLEIAFEGGSVDELEAALSCLSTVFESAANLDGECHQLVVALGGAAAPTGGFDDVRLAEEAEEALAEARASSHYVVKNLAISNAAFDRRTLVADFSAGLLREEFFVQYQPKVNLRRQTTSSAEALIRWNHPERGLISPAEFIPALEESQDIGSLTLWTIARVIVDQKMLAEQGHDIMLFVNISGQLLADAGFVARACQMVRSCGARIGFEITETSVIRDPQTAIAHLHVFADMGIDLAIDDYGAGLSSLAYLKQLPAKELKIDKMFVMQLTSSHRDPLIVRSTIDLAHALEMEVTAEGVETQSALALLSVMGCDMVQGYLLSRPIGIAALKVFLDEGQHPAAANEPRASFIRPPSFWKSA
jgi:EAL domain-containing protein (putative c-di-GMP-specific phosphodiesterase class I)